MPEACISLCEVPQYRPHLPQIHNTGDPPGGKYQVQYTALFFESLVSRGILKLLPTVKKLQKIFSILLMIPIRVCCLPRHALFFFINQTGWIRVGCGGARSAGPQ
jgi:hypothetical protein